MYAESIKDITSKAILYAFGADGLIVYSGILDLDQYYEGGQIFDSWDSIKAAGIVRLIGILFDDDGNITKEFEQTYDEESGRMTGGRSYSYREHLQTDERYQMARELFEKYQNERKSRDA